MITGAIKSQIDRIWDAFWSGGISNPLEVIEQITYLLFLRRLDDLQLLEENKAARLKRPIERRVFPEGSDAKGRPYDDLRWSRFQHFGPAEMFDVVDQHSACGSDDRSDDRTGACHAAASRSDTDLALLYTVKEAIPPPAASSNSSSAPRCTAAEHRERSAINPSLGRLWRSSKPGR
jgi:hypothetical protein